MVFLRHTLMMASVAVMLLCFVIAQADSASTKIAYKKPIYNKSNAIKDKRVKVVKTDLLKPTKSMDATTVASTAAMATSATPAVSPSKETASSTAPDASNNGNAYELENTSASESVEIVHDDPEKIVEEDENISSFVLGSMTDTIVVAEMNSSITPDAPSLSGAPTAASNSTRSTSTSTSTTGSTSTTTTTTTTTTTESNLPVPCTCGIFMTSQIKRGSSEPPKGRPVIVNELDRTFPCNPIGHKQCQTKCLESIVQHLPNSANILCASLDRDCRKERAYLFIKNCRNHWSNTNLAAGREYCCRNSQPYPCPLM